MEGPSWEVEGITPTWLCENLQEDPLIKYWRDKCAEHEDHIKKLNQRIEFLQDSVQRAQHQHDLDYQLWLLRDKSEEDRKKRAETPCGGGQGKGYVAVASKITGTYQRQRTWARKVQTELKSPVQQKEESSDDPELEATLLRLLEEGQGKHK